MTEIRTRRLTIGDRVLARRLFAMMAQVFGTNAPHLEDDYIDGLLSRGDFWAIAAFASDDVVGGITAHTLPMTNAAASELFIFDVAVREQQQRTGIGRAMMSTLLDAAARAGIQVAFVPADNEDVHALAFYHALGGAPTPVTLFTFSRPDR